jgi:hypothetical protein
MEYNCLQGNDAQHADWFQQICANALAEIQAEAVTQTFQQAQERTFTLIAELLNMLLHIRFHQRGISLRSKLSQRVL